VDLDDVRSVVHLPIELDGDFPLTVGPVEPQDDRPIQQLHWHDSIEIGLCLDGAGIFVIGDRVVPFSAGVVTVIGPTQVHLARSAPGTVSRWRWIYLDPIRILRLMGDDPALDDPLVLAGGSHPNVVTPGADPEAASIIGRLVAELAGRRAGYRTIAEALAVEFFVHLHRLSAEATPTTTSAPHPGLGRIAPAISAILANLAQPLVLGELARACGVSEATLRRQFILATGRSPQQYWLDLRVQMAASMLRSTDLPVLEVSASVGFQTLSSFNALFRRRYGVSPREWRRDVRSRAEVG